MKNINLNGKLICQNDAEIKIVAEFLNRHVELTRAELGCISFDVHQTEDPHIFDVTECFQNAEAFAFHQARVKVSEWGHATVGIKRRYSVTES